MDELFDRTRLLLAAMSNPELYTVGWICAISTEYTAARQFLDKEHERPDHVSPSDSNDYTLGEIAGHNVVIAVLPDQEYGLSSAASVAVDMINSFPNIRIGLMVGIGGGAPSATRDIRLGDVVVSSPRDSTGGVYQYDYGKTVQGHTFQQTGFLNQPPTLVRTAVSGLRSKFESDGHRIEESIDTILQKKPKLRTRYRRPAQRSDRLYESNIIHPQEREGSCTELCGTESVVERPPRSEEDDNSAIHYGIIASANQLMKDAIVRDALVAEKGILCFEMEAAGLMNRFPCLVIRGICDYSDSHKNKDWQGYAAMAAAAYAKELLKRMVPSRVESEERLRKALACISDEIAAIQFTAQKTDDSLGALRLQSRSDKVRRWLMPSDPSTNYVEALHQRQEGTGLWFLQSETFKCWRKEPNSFLWLYEIPGCGKTILSSTILRCLEEPSTVRPVLLYFFFDFNDTRKQSLDDLARSLIVQLSRQHSEAQKDLDSLFQSHEDGAKQPATILLVKTLQTMLSHVDQASIVLDALDESKTRKGLLTWIHDFFKSKVTKLHVIVTARPEADIDLALRDWTTEKQRISLQSKLVNEDIRAYINERVQRDEGLRRWHSRPDMQKEIESQLMEKADGMFRWASCQLDALEKCYNVSMLRRALSSLPTTLDQTYERILDDIPEIVRPYAVTVLQFLTYSPRPLRLLEILDAIAINPQEKPAFRPENRFSHPREVLKICSSVVTLVTRESATLDTEVSSHNDDENGNVSTNSDDGMLELRLAHFSVKEYLISDRVHGMFKGSLEEITSKASMAETCLSYLCYMDPGLSRQKIAEAYPFAQYCAEYWTKFASVAEGHSENVQRWIRFFFNRKKAYTTSCFLFDPDEDEDILDCLISRPKTPSPIFYASLAGLRVSVQSLLDAGVDNEIAEDDIDDNGRDALYAASSRGHNEIVRILLNKGVDVHNQGTYRCTALIAASSKGHKEVVQILLDWGADVNALGGCFRTALMAASVYGYDDIVRILLDKGADINAKSDLYDTALVAASVRGHEKVVQILLDRGIDVNAQGGCYTSAITAASFYGHKEIVRRLLDKGADANAQVEAHNPALSAALIKSNEWHIRRLFGGVDDGGRYDYDAALVKATGLGLDDLVQMLLCLGADVNAEGGQDNETVLTMASRLGHENIVRTLLDWHADLIQFYYRYWGRAIEAAGSNSHFTIERMLLDYEVKKDTLSRYFRQKTRVHAPGMPQEESSADDRYYSDDGSNGQPSTLDDRRRRRRLKKENECRSIIFTAMRGKEADFAELIDRHRFLSEHVDTYSRNQKGDLSGSEIEIDGIQSKTTKKTRPM